jgi:hypothetical protein
MQVLAEQVLQYQLLVHQSPMPVVAVVVHLLTEVETLPVQVVPAVVVQEQMLILIMLATELQTQAVEVVDNTANFLLSKQMVQVDQVL